MKKTLKCTLIILLVLAMTLGLAATAFASDDLENQQVEEVITDQPETEERTGEISFENPETEEITEEVAADDTEETTVEEAKDEIGEQTTESGEEILEDKNDNEITAEKYAGLSSETISVIESLDEGQQYAEGELIVIYDNAETAECSASLMSVDGCEAEVINGDESVLVTFDENEISMEDKIIELSREEGVAYVQPNYFYYLNDGFDYNNIYSDYAENGNTYFGDIYDEYYDEICDGYDSIKYEENFGDIYDVDECVIDESTSEIMSTKIEKVVNDTYADKQIYFRQINICEAWDVVKKYGKSKVSVAVIDTGALMNHEDLGNLDSLLSRDVTTSNAPPYERMKLTIDTTHGSHITGIIGATANNGKGIAGGATLGLSDSSSWLHIFAINAFTYDKNGKLVAKSSDLNKAIKYAVDNGAKIINMSLGYQGTTSTWNTDVETRTAIDYAYNNNVICVCAAGNSNTTSHEWPSDYEKVISVIALDTISDNIVSYTRVSYNKADFSNYGADKDIAAPGVNILSVYPTLNAEGSFYKYNTNDYGYCKGTSQATPIVTSVIALMCMMNPNLTFNQVYNIITSTAEDLLCHKGYVGYDIYTAYGMINAQACVLALVPETFSDVHQADWFYSAVSYVNYRGIMTGLGGTNRFAPGDKLTREQFAVILYRLAGSPKVDYVNKFKDVPKGTWYTDAIIWAYKNNIITGYGDGSGKFGVGDLINREQFATMLYRYSSFKKYPVTTKVGLTGYKDYMSVSSWAKDALQWAVGTGVVTGKDNKTKIDPQGYATRCECATMIQRLLIRFDW